MAILPIRAFPDPILRTRCHPVTKIDAPLIQLARDMMETMHNANGIGLAANQVGVLKRVITLAVPGDIERILINPHKKSSAAKREVEEGCLSLPGYTGLITRAVKVTARYLDEHGAKLQLTAEELLAQAIEHEIDHLNGILYIDHLKEHENLAKTGVTADEPHWHDVGYKIYVEDSGSVHKRDQENIELLKSVAELSKLNQDAHISDASYDANYSGKVAEENIDENATRLRGV